MKTFNAIIIATFVGTSCSELPKTKTKTPVVNEPVKTGTIDTSGNVTLSPTPEGAVSTIVVVNQNASDVCMGTFVSQDTIATAKHCITRDTLNLCSSTKILLTKYDVATKTFKVTKTSLECDKKVDSETLDLSFVKLKPSQVKYQAYLASFDETPVTLQEALESPYPAPSEFSVGLGFVFGITAELITSNIKNVQGMSGSPVFRRNTNFNAAVSLVGMHLKTNTGTQSEALPAKSIQESYQAAVTSGVLK